MKITYYYNTLDPFLYVAHDKETEMYGASKVSFEEAKQELIRKVRNLQDRPPVPPDEEIPI